MFDENGFYASIIPLIDRIKDLGNDIVGCEIGVCEGCSLKYTLENADIKIIHAIDPYVDFQDFYGRIEQDVLDNFKQKFEDIQNGFENKINFIQKYSDDAKDDIEDDSLDYIFIDGNHSYDFVCRDMQNYYSKVKSGGLFAGHDWDVSDVQKAVKEFMEANNIPEEKLQIDQDKIRPWSYCWSWIK